MKKLVVLFASLALAACGQSTVDAAGDPNAAPAAQQKAEGGCCSASVDGGCCGSEAEGKKEAGCCSEGAAPASKPDDKQ